MTVDNTSSVAPPAISDGDTAWMLASTALVMLMTPGLAFFYGGFVRQKNVINTMMMSYVTLGVVALHWVVVGYSFSFGGGHSVFGNFEFAGLMKVNTDPNPDYAPTIPHLIFCCYQMMFAIITPGIISGAVVERMKFPAYLLFVLLWTTLVYDAIAHWIWSAWSYKLDDGTSVTSYGWLRAIGSIDFAGGTAVHISSAVSALVAAKIVGPRRDPDTQKANQVPYILLGAGLLWFGWFGFNGGSALASAGLACIAFMNSQISAAASMTIWVVMDMAIKKETCAIGAASGAVVGLVLITPAAGFVHSLSSIAIGVVGTMVVYGSIQLKKKLENLVDDTLDVFTCHGVGGIMGCLLTGFFASKQVNEFGADGVFFGNPVLLGYQLVAVISTIAWSATITAAILLPIKITYGLRVGEDAAGAGLDQFFHGFQHRSHSIALTSKKAPVEDPKENLNPIMKKDEETSKGADSKDHFKGGGDSHKTTPSLEVDVSMGAEMEISPHRKEETSTGH